MSTGRKLPDVFETSDEEETTDVTNLESVYGGMLRHLAAHTDKLDKTLDKFADETRGSISEIVKAVAEIAVNQGRMDERLNGIKKEIEKGHVCERVEDVKSLFDHVRSIEESRNRKRDEQTKRRWIIVPIVVTISIAMVPVITRGVFRTYDVLNAIETQTRQISNLEKILEEKTESSGRLLNRYSKGEETDVGSTGNR